jgi:hypothetical protein
VTWTSYEESRQNADAGFPGFSQLPDGTQQKSKNGEQDPEESLQVFEQRRQKQAYG